MDKKLIIVGVILVFVFVGSYLYVSNRGTTSPLVYNRLLTEDVSNRGTTSPLVCNQLLTENELESVMGGEWIAPSDLTKVQGDLCTVTFQQGDKSLVLSTSPSVISGINVYELLRLNLKNSEYISETNELGERSFRVTADNGKKIVFQKGDMAFIISSSAIDFREMKEVGQVVEEKV